jgi:Phage tail sheath protein subtilisin-like domain/Phage tail sheath C-terminal domain
MPFQLSPGVNVTEIDLTTVVPAVSTSVGAIAGVFGWGPVNLRVTLASETDLVTSFGRPSNLNAETWFTAANFLSYSNNLIAVRAANTGGSTPAVSFSATSSNNVFTAANTTGLVAGMYVSQTGNSSIVGAGNTVTIASVNSSAIVLSQNAAATGTVTLYLASPNSAYTAVGVVTGAQVANLSGQVVINENSYANVDGTFDSNVLYVARYPGGIGNSLRVSVCDTANAYSSNVSLSNNTWTATNLALTIGSNTATLTSSNGSGANASSNAFVTGIAANLAVGDLLLVGNASIGTQYLRVTTISSAVTNSTVSSVTIGLLDTYRLSTNFNTSDAGNGNTIQRKWEFFNVVDVAPGQSDQMRFQGNSAANDELHVVVSDTGGRFTGVPGTILEIYKSLSRATDAKTVGGENNYYKTVINQQSQYVWWANDRSGAASANAFNVASSTNNAALNMQFALGTDGDSESAVPLSVITQGYDSFQSAEQVDVSLVLQGKGIGGSTLSGGQTVNNFQLANYIIDNIVSQRKDCVALVSPDKNTVVNNIGYETSSVVNWRNVIHDTSYAVLDSGYKYQYDRYNDLYRWIPLNGDVGGLCARTDQTNDAWWSPAGFNRGQIKNLVKLAYNPKKTDRDNLYKAGVNPVVSFPGQGVVLFGDKTLQSKPSAFDRINVRRLFIVLEKAIATAAKFSLFEFNDAFTRRQFVNLVTPYLRDVQGRRGIYDFKVVCDETNNTPQVIDTNSFVGDIYIKPARSINFIQLNFVAVATGVQFSEVIGQF